MPRAEIASKQALYTLAKLYSELAGKLRRAKDKAPIRANIEHVAATMLLLDPHYDLGSIRPVKRYNRNPLFKRGECFPAVLALLRQGDGPLTSKEIATRLLQGRGISRPDRKMIAHMVGAVHTSLRNHQGKTVVEVQGRPMRWEIKPS